MANLGEKNKYCHRHFVCGVKTKRSETGASVARTDGRKARNIQEVNRFAGKNKSQDCIGAVWPWGF